MILWIPLIKAIYISLLFRSYCNKRSIYIFWCRFDNEEQVLITCSHYNQIPLYLNRYMNHLNRSKIFTLILSIFLHIEHMEAYRKIGITLEIMFWGEKRTLCNHSNPSIVFKVLSFLSWRPLYSENCFSKNWKGTSFIKI